MFPTPVRPLARPRSAPRLLALLCLAMGLLPLSARAATEDDAGQAELRAARWSPELVRTFESIPIQEGGRLKPMRTFADFKLLRLHGTRSLALASVSTWDRMRGKRPPSLTPAQWLLDCLFFPDDVVKDQLFRVETWEVLNAIGVSTAGKKKFDRYSYQELEPGLAKLYDLSDRYDMRDPKSLSYVERQISGLGHAVGEFEQLIHFGAVAKARYRVEGSDELRQRLGLGEHEEGLRLSDLLPKTTLLSEAFRDLEASKDSLPASDYERESKALTGLLDQLDQSLPRVDALPIVPPDDQKDNRWKGPSELAQGVFQRGAMPSAQSLAVLASLEDLFSLDAGSAAFGAKLQSIAAQVREVAKARGVLDEIDEESLFYRAQPFFWGWIVFTLAFVVTAFVWLFPRSRWLVFLASGFALLALALVTYGLVLRAMINHRPPVTGLYETIPFITAGAVLTALFLEWINRKRVGLTLAVLVGAIGMALAHKYESIEGKDTIAVLPAVLDTNFWLATHVTCITLGYSAGLLAALLGATYGLSRLLGIRLGDPQYYRSLARMTYGVVCFTVVLSTVGTILGGIWANESWGRFWGWDPKENGALLIVLWNLILLHMRMGGYAKDGLFCLLATLGGIVVSFSWWGVNLLQVGLHSYGFSSGIGMLAMVMYTTFGVLSFLGLLSLLRPIATFGEVAKAKAAAEAGTPGVEVGGSVA